MRDIKFRAWNGEVMINRALFECNWYGKDDNMVATPRDVRALRVMQFTGLKDKNGVEIYEGDILALDNENERHSYHIYKIEYNADKARFVGVDGDEISCMPSIVNHHDGAGRYMVIGNAYENPESLA